MQYVELSKSREIWVDMCNVNTPTSIYLTIWTSQGVLKCPSQEVGGIDITHAPTKPICSSVQVKRLGHIEITHTPPPHQTDVLKCPSQEVGVLTLHIPPPHQTNVLKSPSQEVRGVLTLHIPPTKLMCSSLQVKRWGYWHYTYPPPPNWCAQVSKSRGGGYWHYTYPIKLMWSSLQVKRWGYWHYTYPHQTNVLKSPSQEVGGIDITHTPHQTDMLKSPSQEVGDFDITHTPPTKPMCSSLQVKRWGVLTLHIPPPTKPMCSTILVGGVSILMGKFSSQFQNQKLSTVCRLCRHNYQLNFVAGTSISLSCTDTAFPEHLGNYDNLMWVL